MYSNKTSEKSFLHTGIIVFLIISVWIYAGWPQIFNFPPKVQKVYAAVGFDASTKSEGTGSRTFNHTITGTNVGLVVFVGTGKGSCLTVTGVTYNAVALSFVREDQNGTNACTEVWQLAAPATGTNEVVVTITGNPDPVMAVAMSFTGTNQTTLVSNHNGATGATSVATVDVTSATGRFVADMYAEVEGPDSVVGAGQTE